MAKENGLTKRQQEVLSLIRKGTKVSVDRLVELSEERELKTGEPGLAQNRPVANYHLRSLEDQGYLKLVEGGGRGQLRTWKRVA